jgi:ATPase involved in DNA repair
MQFNRVVIENIGNFFGRYEFDLRPKQDKGNPQPVVLFGGLNGAGKTTIFESIKLCLYGSEALGAISVAKYHEYLREKFISQKHRCAPELRTSRVRIRICSIWQDQHLCR